MRKGLPEPDSRGETGVEVSLGESSVSASHSHGVVAGQVLVGHVRVIRRCHILAIVDTEP